MLSKYNRQFTDLQTSQRNCPNTFVTISRRYNHFGRLPAEIHRPSEPVSKSYRQYFRDFPLCYTLMTPDLNKNMSLSRSLQVKEIGNIGFEMVQRVAINRRGSVNTAVIRPYPESRFSLLKSKGFEPMHIADGNRIWQTLS